MIFKALQFKLFRFKFNSLSSKILKIPEFNLSIAEIGQEPFQDTSTKKQLEAVIKAQVANERSKTEKINQVLLKSMTKMELKIEEQQKELDMAQKELQVRLRAQWLMLNQKALIWIMF